MQGSKSCEGRLFYQVTLESLVPEGHLVRRLAKIIDLGWTRAATAEHYSHTGRPSIDPVVIAKMMILGFLYNISSERQLMREIQVNLAYRWYLGYDLDEEIPNHSVLSKARRRLGQAFFEKLFAVVLELCRQAGLVDGGNALIDSTLVKADASLDSVKPLMRVATDYMEQLEANCQLPKEDTKPADKSRELGTNRPGSNRISDQKRSTTDADATLARKGGTTVLGYKTHVCADSDKGVITAVTASTAAVDDTSAVPELLDRHYDGLGQMPRRAVTDGSYGSQDCLAYIQDRGIQTVIKKRSGGNRHGGYDKSLFVYNGAEDVFLCPAGQRLERIRTDKKKGKAHYRCDAELCGCCEQRLACLGKTSPAKARTVTRFETPYEARAKAACSSPLGRKLLRIRKTLLEGLFGEGKNFHGLGRARWRGLENMMIQSLVIATVLNLKKLVASLSRANAAAAAGAASFSSLILDNCRLARTILALLVRKQAKICCEIML
jgi:transposase